MKTTCTLGEIALNRDPKTNNSCMISPIMAQALFKISDCTIPAINQMLQNLFAGRGRCYVTDTGGMELRFVFEFQILPFELAMLTQSGVMPKPAGVFARAMQIDIPTTFGFKGSSGLPFGQGVFFSSSGLTDAY